MSKIFNSRSVLVTGAGSGIGKAIAIAFAKEGANLVLVGRTESKLQETLNEIKSLEGNNKVVLYTGDVGREETNKNAVELALKEFGQLNIAINNAGIGSGGNVVDATNSIVDTLLDTNIKSVIYGTKYQLPAIGKSSTKQNQGSIINISSVLSKFIRASNNPIYAATKGFIDTFTLATAKEGANYNVRVNSVNPGLTVSEGVLDLFGNRDIMKKFTNEYTLADDAASTQEIASFVLDVTKNRFINASILFIDGGAQAK